MTNVGRPKLASWLQLNLKLAEVDCAIDRVPPQGPRGNVKRYLQ
jgi:hypothetical protein